MTELSRREFLRHTAAGAAAAGTVSLVNGGSVEAESVRPKLPMREFGKTGVRVSILALGGGGTGRNPQIRGTRQRPQERELAEKIIGRAFEEGVNYFDSCTGYGASEEIMGEVLKPHRKEVFLVTKCGRPTSPEDQLRRELELSLTRLQTDQLDVWQIHNVNNMNQVRRIFGKGGAVEVAQRAKEEGLTRFIGITSHSSAKVLTEAIERCTKEGIKMEAVLVGLNIADSMAGGYGSAFAAKYANSAVGLAAMKVFGSDGAPLLRYPGIDAEKALRYVWSKPIASAVIGTHSLTELEESIRIASEFEPMGEEEMAAFEQHVAKTVKPVWTLKS